MMGDITYHYYGVGTNPHAKKIIAAYKGFPAMIYDGYPRSGNRMTLYPKERVNFLEELPFRVIVISREIIAGKITHN